MPAPKMKSLKSLTAKFTNLLEKDTDTQAEFFLKSFIFDLGDNWKIVGELATKFKKYLKDKHEKNDLNPVQAGEFLQKNGKTRTSGERKKECKDIDLNNDGRIGFLEYALLHFKIMILTAYYKRYDEKPKEDLSNDGIGLIGVGHKLLDELFTLPEGLDPALIAAIEEFTAKKRKREKKIMKLEAKSAKGGVMGKAAANELKQMESQDLTWMNRIELTLAAAKKKGKKATGEEEMKKKKLAEQKERDAKAAASKAKLAARAAMFGGTMKSTLKKTKTRKSNGKAKAKLNMAIKGTKKRPPTLKKVGGAKKSGPSKWARDEVKKQGVKKGPPPMKKK